jgi:hypothetical protein
MTTISTSPLYGFNDRELAPCWQQLLDSQHPLERPAVAATEARQSPNSRRYAVGTAHAGRGPGLIRG